MHRALVSAAAGAAVILGGSAHAWASPVGTDVQPGRAAYTVQPGDSFWSVGQRFDVTMADVAGWNHLDLEAPLDAGWTLQIPPVGWHTPTAAAAVGGYTVHPTVQPAPRHASWVASRATTGARYTGAGIWGCIAAHESGGNPGTNTGNGYYGLYQFTLGTWHSAGGSGNPAAASAAEQTAVAQRVLAQQGWSAWPVTSRLCGA